MGMVYQNPIYGLRMNFSTAANIAEKLIAAGNRNVEKMTERVTELLEAVEILNSRMGEAPKNFSGGMQQRVQISKALANNPSLLLLDEVTRGLISRSRQRCSISSEKSKRGIAFPSFLSPTILP
jgi:putative phosphonate transport system ATP-binding protein